VKIAEHSRAPAFLEIFGAVENIENGEHAVPTGVFAERPVAAHELQQVLQGGLVIIVYDSQSEKLIAGLRIVGIGGQTCRQDIPVAPLRAT
jgi:hypothetical protein